MRKEAPLHAKKKTMANPPYTKRAKRTNSKLQLARNY